MSIYAATAPSSGRIVKILGSTRAARAREPEFVCSWHISTVGTSPIGRSGPKADVHRTMVLTGNGYFRFWTVGYARPVAIVCSSVASASGAVTCGEWLASIS
jgi:hypothetical protein